MNEQEKREKIIGAFEQIRDRAPLICTPGERFLKELAIDALALLEAQEPRLLTAADFKDNPLLDKFGRLPCWCEDTYGDDGWAAITVGGTMKSHIKNSGCRYWTSRPTDEQMEATPWP